MSWFVLETEQTKEQRQMSRKEELEWGIRQEFWRGLAADVLTSPYSCLLGENHSYFEAALNLHVGAIELSSPRSDAQGDKSALNTFNFVHCSSGLLSLVASFKHQGFTSPDKNRVIAWSSALQIPTRKTRAAALH